MKHAVGVPMNPALPAGLDNWLSVPPTMLPYTHPFDDVVSFPDRRSTGVNTFFDVRAPMLNRSMSAHDRMMDAHDRMVDAPAGFYDRSLSPGNEVLHAVPPVSRPETPEPAAPEPKAPPVVATEERPPERPARPTKRLRTTVVDAAPAEAASKPAPKPAPRSTAKPVASVPHTPIRSRPAEVAAKPKLRSGQLGSLAGSVAGLGLGAAGLAGLYSLTRRNREKAAFFNELSDTWQGLDPTHKVLTGLGGALAAGSLLNGLRPESGTVGNLLGTVGGLGLAGYGLSGGHLEALGPTLQHILAGGPKPNGSVSPVSPPVSQTGGAGPSAGLAGLESLSHHPRLGHYFKGDQPDMQEIIKTPDATLKSDLLLLSPEQRALLKSQLAGFKPSFGQRLGARAMGIDINAQKDRFNQLLG